MTGYGKPMESSVSLGSSNCYMVCPAEPLQRHNKKRNTPGKISRKFNFYGLHPNKRSQKSFTETGALIRFQGLGTLESLDPCNLILLKSWLTILMLKLELHTEFAHSCCALFEAGYQNYSYCACLDGNLFIDGVSFMCFSFCF